MASTRSRDSLRDALANKAGTLLKRPAARKSAPPAASDAVPAPSPSHAPASASPPAGSPAVLRLPATLLIGDVRAFADTLREAAGHGDIDVDASGLGDVDTAGLQLLCAARAAVAAGGHEFRWNGQSPVLQAAARTTGLVQALGLAA
jgi:anti-anti-sigma regulatory factor